MKIKLLLGVLIIVIGYVSVSLLIYRGKFSPTHYYSYDDIAQSKEKGAFVSNNLKVIIEGDSLKQVTGLNEKFYTNKSMYQKFYGFLFHTTHEDSEYRRLKWEEPLKYSDQRNWIIVKDSKYLGEAFFSGFLDVKIGETVLLEVRNKKTDYKIGTIKIFIE